MFIKYIREGVGPLFSNRKKSVATEGRQTRAAEQKATAIFHRLRSVMMMMKNIRYCQPVHVNQRLREGI